MPTTRFDGKPCGPAFAKHGVDLALEEAANDILWPFLAAVKSKTAKSDILTPWKETNRHNREVYVRSGVADESIRSGMFGRALNLWMPWLNSRDGDAGYLPLQKDTSPRDWDDASYSLVAAHIARVFED